MHPSLTHPTLQTRISSPRVASRVSIAIILFVFFSLLCLALRSNQFTAVDGALRCLEVYHHPHLFFHGNNHLLYPVNVLAWSKLASSLGLSLATPTEYMHVSQSMNSLSAAATVALLWLLVSGMLDDPVLSLLLVSVYGFSRAFVFHATNSAEPVVGLMYAIASLLMLRIALQRNNWVFICISGILLGLALATYQAMFLVVGGCLWMCFFPEAAGLKDYSTRFGIRTASIFSIACALTVAAIFGSAFSSQGVQFGWPMIQKFFLIGGGADVYGRFSISKLLNFPIGLLNDLAPVVPNDYGGIRSLLARPDRRVWFVRVAVVGALVYIPLITWAISSLRKYKQWPQRWKWLILAGVGVMIPIFWPALYWDPMYDKLWLLPLAVLTLFISYVASMVPWRGRTRSTALFLLLALAAIEIPSNLYRAFRDSRSETQGLKEASRLMSIVTQNDGIVVDFDKVSSLYVGYAGTEHAIVLPAMSPSTAKPSVDALLAACRAKGGHLYFFEIMDESEVAWNSFLGARVGIPYSSFAQYRSHSRVVEQFPMDGHPLTLRVYDGD